MMDDFKSKFKALYEKIKKVKHIEIYLAIGLAILLAIIYFVSLPKDKSSDVTQNDNLSTNFSSSQEYVEYLENKLENVLARVDGAGKVDVIITLDKGFEYIYVTEEETRTTSNGTVITTSSIVMVDGEPVLQEEIYPTISGIVVVAEGANDVNVKLNMISILQTIIEINSSKINIIKGN